MPETDSRSLFKALMAEDTEMLAGMLDAGGDINAVNAAGLTLLQVATERGKHKSRRFLRLRGASRFDPAERRRLRALINTTDAFESHHTIGDAIGSGGYANVYAGTRHADNGGDAVANSGGDKIVAVKLIAKDSSFNLEDLLSECDMMLRSTAKGHENIVKFYDAFGALISCMQLLTSSFSSYCGIAAAGVWWG